MTNGRPYYRAYVTWTDTQGSKTTPPLDIRKIDALQQIAASTAVAAEERAHNEISVHRWGFAEGVSAVLAWLAGEPPTTELASLLELEDDDSWPS